MEVLKKNRRVADQIDMQKLLPCLCVFSTFVGTACTHEMLSQIYYKISEYRDR